MGVGDPLEASYPLKGAIAAGRWHLVGDGIVLQAADLQFDVLWGTQVVVSFSHHFDVPTGAQQFDAVPFEADADGAAVPAKPGDRLVLRMTATSSSAGAVFIPNADGPHTHGRIPSLTLP